MRFDDLDQLRGVCRDLPAGSATAADEAARRQGRLTKPMGSLGRLEELAVWMARWQETARPRVDTASVLVFAGNHGVAECGVSAFPPSVTAQMVANFAAGGAAINQLSRLADADLRVVPMALDTPTRDFTTGPAMSEREFLDAVAIGWDAVPSGCQLLAVGEMGIGNTTAASGICAALLGRGARGWVGRGTGVDDAGIARKDAVISAALRHHRSSVGDPLAIAAAMGGRELAAILGAVLSARRLGVPVLLDGFVVCAAVLPLALENADALAHCRAAHRSAEAAHGRLLQRLELDPLLALDMRLGEASGSAVAIMLVRAALACHDGMATFDDAGVSDAVAKH